MHICHAFLTVSGSKRERAKAALVDMGPAVLNGGVSTLIAFILLLSSDSYFFLTFFKIFFLTVLFGVWHGLVLLPVLLSLFGPEAYLSARSSFQWHRSHHFLHLLSIFNLLHCHCRCHHALFSSTSTEPNTAVATLGKVGEQQSPTVAEVENEKPRFFALSCSCSCFTH